jgi:hypothetical protein
MLKLPEEPKSAMRYHVLSCDAHLVAHGGVGAGKLEEERWQVRLQNGFKLVIFCKSDFHFDLANEFQLPGLGGCGHL